MHHNKIPYEEMEKEADQFASAFLMPVDDLILELQPVTIEHMLQLKPSWKVSMQALIHRAKDIGEITESRYTSLFQQLSRAGYRKKEPVTIQREKPELIHTLITIYKEQLDYDDNDIAKLLNINVTDFQKWYSSSPDNILPFPKNQTA